MGFSYPQGLAALGFLAVLVWIYLRERHQRPLEVPSLLLWQSMREETRRRRFLVDPLFVAQALLLASLGLGVARPYFASSSAVVELRRAVLVMDTSASMQALEWGERRFDRARRKALDVLRALGSGYEVMIVAVDTRPRVAVAFTRERAVAIRALGSLEPGDAPTRLPLGVQLARSVRGATTASLDIYVFTDVPRTALTVPIGAGERLHYYRFGKSDDNVALAALRVYQTPFQDAGEARAYALVKNYSSFEKEVSLIVTLESIEVMREAFRLGPREGRAVPIRGLGRAGKLEARLDGADAFDVDDRALAFVKPVGRLRLLLVTGSDDVATDFRALAEAVPALELAEAPPDDVSETAWREADVALLHGWVPESPSPPPVNALFVYPPPENALFPAAGEVLGAQILDWNERDPILRDLRYVEALPLGRARILERPAWARTLIASRTESEEFALAFAGEVSGRRIVCFAFDLAGQSLRRSENLSLLLLVLNALRWLTPPDLAQPVQVDLGDRYREVFATPVTTVVSAPNGDRLTWPPRTQVSFDVDRRGVYHVDAGGAPRTIFANLFDPEESAIGREGEAEEEVVEAGTAPGTMVTAKTVQALEWWLYFAAVVLVFAEWGSATWLRRRGDG